MIVDIFVVLDANGGLAVHHEGFDKAFSRYDDDVGEIDTPISAFHIKLDVPEPRVVVLDGVVPPAASSARLSVEEAPNARPS